MGNVSLPHSLDPERERRGRAKFHHPLVALALLANLIWLADSGALAVGPTTPEQAKLIAFDAAAGDNFGVRVALSGDTAVVGAWLDDDGGIDSGSAYVFVRSGTTWTQQAKLTASDAAAGDNFGVQVALSGNTAVVGAWHDQHAGFKSGSAYVFIRSGITWTQQAKLTAADTVASDEFGVDLAVSGDSVVVGAWNDDDAGSSSGSAYVFLRSGTTWTQQTKLTASDATAVDVFGASVAIFGDSVVVGAYGNDDAGSLSGSAYVFVRSGTTWTQQAKLTASDAASNDEFGRRVVISGDTAVVGAWNDDDGGSNSGSAYIFVRSGTTWTQQAKLTASDAAAGDNFGLSVALSGDTALVAALNDDDAGADSGSAYVFVRSGTIWTQEPKLTASDAAAGDQFGSVGVALSGDTALVGAWHDDDAGVDSGSAYAFVPANSAPDCSGATPSEVSLFPPDHMFRDITFTGVTDTDGDTITITVDSIFQDEAVDAPGTGNTAPDGQGFGTSTAEVRAERAGSGNGRVYIIEFTADDGNGGSCPGVVLVGVPHNKKNTAVDDGALFDSTVIP